MKLSLMKNPVRAFVVLMSLLIVTTTAGIRGPGEYHGVVIFDRWDTCYIYSGVYLMYVSQRAKSHLRAYQGQAMVIEALRVNQPMNPGDGRINKLRVIEPDRVRRTDVRVDGIVLKLSPQFSSGGPRFTLEIHNQSQRSVEIRSEELALTLLGKKGERVRFFDPSDGLSTALITRTSLRDQRMSGTGNDIDDACFWTLGARPLPDRFRLRPGRFRSITISLTVPKGEYDFLCGYGGGVHYDKALASNLVAFDLDEHGRATSMNISGR